MVYLKCGLNGSVFHNMNRCFVQNVKRNYIFYGVDTGNVTLRPLYGPAVEAHVFKLAG